MTSLPSHWRSGRIKWDCDTVAGATPSTDDDSLWLAGDDPKGTPFVAIADMSRHERVASTAKSVSVDGMVSKRMPIGQPGTLLLAMYASVGELAFLDIEATWNQALLGITPDPDEVDAGFLRYALLNMRDDLLREVRSNTQANLNAQQVGDIWFQKPPLEEQRAIADYLDRETARIDTLIAEQQCLIEMLRERRVAVISAALSPGERWVRSRIKRLGETSLGKMLDAGRAARDGDQSRPYVRAADVRADGSVNLFDLNEMPFSDAEMSAFDLREGDVVLIEGGATVGRPGFMFDSAPGVAFQKTVNRLRVGPQSDARFVYWSMLHLYESGYYVNHYGSVSFVHLTGEKLREIELHLPTLGEQRAIAAQLDEQDAKLKAMIGETERFIELSRERRAALITAAVTGQIDVRDLT